MTDTDDNGTLSALNAGASLGQPRRADGDYAIVPQGYVLNDLEPYQRFPRRKRGNVSMSTVESFIAYVNKHYTQDYSVIYAALDPTKYMASMVAVLNDHSSLNADWRDHKCTFIPKGSVEFGRWLGKDRMPMKQVEFAAWLEDNLGDIATVEGFPTGVEILKMAIGFEATADKRLKSRINLQSGGVRFEFVDDEDKDTRTTMEAYSRFMLGLPVFYGAKVAYQVEARLKYREHNGSLTFWYELIRPDKVFAEAIEEDLKRVVDETDVMMLYGSM